MSLIKGKQIATGDDGIQTTNIKNLAVTTDKIAASAVEPGKVNLGASGWNFTALVSCNQTPASSNDLTNKSYVDAAVAGLDWKDSVRAATAAAGTLADDFANTDTIDTSVTLATGDRILIKNQVDASENGIYVVQVSGAPVRASDLPATASAAGTAVFVEEGTANADKGFVCTSDDGSDVVGTDDLTFTAFTGTSSLTYAAPTTIVPDASQAEGSASSVARSDHVHAISAAAPVTAIQPGASAAEGTGNDFARSTHIHAISCAAPGTSQLGTAKAEGSASTFSRSDHVHKANTAAVALGAAGAIGDSDDIARANHVHPRDVQVQETLTAQNIADADAAITDTLASEPISNASVQLYLNGVLQEQGTGKDYTLATQTITWRVASGTGTGTAVDMETSDVLVAKYVTAGS
jgi:hypothetical protein